MYKKFKGKLVDIYMDCSILHGTLIEKKNNSLKLLIVDNESETMEEAIINIKKVNYIKACVYKVTRSKKTDSLQRF
jgi:hypothetical protein